MRGRGLMAGVILAGLLWTGVVTAAEAIPVVLIQARESIAAALNRADADCARAAERLGGTGLTGNEARRVLAALCAAHPEAEDCAAVDLTGRMLTVEPAAWRSAEGADISGQSQVILLQKSRKPVLSGVFRSVEGIDAVDLAHPVVSPDKGFIGSVSMLIRPETLLESALGPTATGRSAIRVAQADGRILFSPEWREIGKMLPLDAPASLAARFFPATSEAKAACADREGPCAEPEPIRTTVSLHGTIWQLIMSPPAP